MALPDNPISGCLVLGNSAGISDRWTCPNCYADHDGNLENSKVDCRCGACLELTIERAPICVATCIDPEEDDDDDR